MVEPALDDATGNLSRSHGTLRRTALILLGGAAGILVGFVLLTALARPASAATLPTGVIPSAATVPASPDNPVSSSLPIVPALTGAVTAATDAVPPAVVPAINPTVVPPVVPVPLPSIPTVTQGLPGGLQTLAGSAASTASTLATMPLVGSAPTASIPPTGSAPTPAANGGVVAATGRPFADTSGPSRTAAGSTVNGLAAGHAPSAPLVPPTSPTPLPTPAAPLQNTPLTANDAAGATASQGGGLFGSPSPASLLPSMSSIGGVRPAREKVPQLLLASRCTPPG
jgi:hypothetical protein